MLRNSIIPFAKQAVASTSRTASFSTVARPAAVATARASTSSNVFGAAVQRRGYHEKVIDHYENPRNVGSFLKTEKNVGIGLVGAPACGDVMKLSIKVNEEGIIEDVRFKTFGCGSAIASSSYMTERVKGLSLDEAAKIKNTEIAQELCLPPVKLHCSMLAEDAIKSAIKNYRSKREATGNKKQGHIEVVQDVATGNTSATAHVGSGTV
ncbi:putative iron-Sulfur cluster nifU-like protein [Mycosarcoma maydis]|uniref:Iron-sulfur cluster assembly protein n=1 Tax=Mycosarcoma maydis TaxID=5270 RepID=A0A0D1DR05_MYCMD|nr:putative iron-Sulfur cluster nifU-like protein [Ustilago maydis 521]KIS66844.1 putative iron-Sulfur cluster nifU-like protein [Ustilago maydis 521]|eukprot:XP_011391409.1 putative iron-Sulfur cluster nifU-like protein [Ustilago maydis 521]